MQTLPTLPAIPETGYMRLPQVLAVFPVSRSTWWAGVRDGRYPKPVRLGARCTAWHADEIRALIESTRSGEANGR